MENNGPPPQLCDDYARCFKYFGEHAASARKQIGAMGDQHRDVPPSQLCDDYASCFKYFAEPLKDSKYVGGNEFSRLPVTRINADDLALALAIVVLLSATFALILVLKQGDGRRECANAPNNADRSLAAAVRNSLYDSDDDSDDEGPCCWICRRGGPNEIGDPLVRDCSCRGESAGFAHLRCLADYAASRSKLWEADEGHMDRFRESWRICPICRQSYQNTLAIDLADMFVAFVGREYPGDRRKRLEVHYRKLTALVNAKMQPKHRAEAREVAEIMLSIIGEIKASTMPPSPAPPTILQIEAVTYNGLGLVALSEGGEDQAKMAVEHFRKLRDISTSIGFVEGVAAAGSNIAIALDGKGEGGEKVSNEDHIKKRRELYNHRVQYFGENAQTTIGTGLNLAVDLWGARRCIEAERLARRLDAVCRRVHGPDHRLTKSAESMLRKMEARYVNIRHQQTRKWKQLRALRYTEDGMLRVAPVSASGDVEDKETFLLSPGYFSPVVATPVMCHGLEGHFLQGKIGDVRRQHKNNAYEIHFEDEDIEPWLIKPKNLRVLFEIPEKESKKAAVEST